MPTLLPANNLPYDQINRHESTFEKAKPDRESNRVETRGRWKTVAEAGKVRALDGVNDNDSDDSVKSPRQCPSGCDGERATGNIAGCSSRWR